MDATTATVAARWMKLGDRPPLISLNLVAPIEADLDFLGKPMIASDRRSDAHKLHKYNLPAGIIFKDERYSKSFIWEFDDDGTIYGLTESEMDHLEIEIKVPSNAILFRTKKDGSNDESKLKFTPVGDSERWDFYRPWVLLDEKCKFENVHALIGKVYYRIRFSRLPYQNKFQWCLTIESSVLTPKGMPSFVR